MLVLQLNDGDIVSIGDMLVVFSEQKGSANRLRIAIDDPCKQLVLREGHFPPALIARAQVIRRKAPPRKNSSGPLGRMREVHSLLGQLLQDKNIYSVVPSAGLAAREIAVFLDSRAHKGDERGK